MNNGTISGKGKGRIMGMIATGLMLLSLFLPFMEASAFGFSESANLISQDGGASMLVFVAVALVVTIAGKPKGMIAGGIFDAVMMIIAVVYAISSTSASVGLLAGFWLYMVASVLLIFAGIFTKKQIN